MEVDTLINIINSKYNLDLIDIFNMKSGYGGDTAIGINKNATKFFIKIFPEDKSHKIDKILTIITEVHQKGYKNMNHPFISKDGKYTIELNNRELAIFNFIDVKGTKDLSPVEYSNLITNLHSLKGKLTSLDIEEKFNEEWLNRVWEILDTFLKAKYTDLKLTKLQELIDSKMTTIKNYWDKFQEIAERCAKSKLEFVPTHGDIFVNILKGIDGKYYLIDWDTVKLGPRERDLWFIKDNTDIIRQYKQVFPNFKINEEVCQYYILLRYFDGLWGFVDGINSSSNEEEIKEYVNQVYEVCFNWLEKLIL